MFKAIDDYLEETILLILLVLMTAIMGVQIVSRYVFQNSLTWSEELVRYMFVWSALGRIKKWNRSFENFFSKRFQYNIPS